MINLTQSAVKPTEEIIRKTFDNINFNGIEDLIEFYMISNGGVPDKNALSGDHNSTIRYFFPIQYRLPNNIENIEETRIFYKSRKDISSFFIDNVPFSIDEGGNIHCLNVRDGCIYFVPMDNGSELEEEKILVAVEFGDFINKLDFFDKVFID
ncbi:SMI1/KNR4 family protein [Methylobacterium indicum]|uniref:SMI1/KNR4 family protein n=1 Tax=Methylobacterium indicum TaxID=1775910 RepID=UPI000A81D4AE|nr:SMI1/KNR4 family protein [Methylobacterium indicum]